MQEARRKPEGLIIGQLRNFAFQEFPSVQSEISATPVTSEMEHFVTLDNG